jgi:hypothetical protein
VRPAGTSCLQDGWAWRWPLNTPANHYFNSRYDEWVEPGDLRVKTDGKVMLVIGPTEKQDSFQHDRTIMWWVLVNDRLELIFLSNLGEARVISPETT